MSKNDNIENNKIQMTRKFKEIQIAVPWGFVAGRWYEPYNHRPILFVHGWADNSGTFDTLMPLLRPGIGFMTIDLSGHGHSSHFQNSSGYEYTDYLHLLLIIMKEYNWEKISILGHSLGGMLGYFFASTFPEKIDLLISIDKITPDIADMAQSMKLMRSRIEGSVKHFDRNWIKSEPPSYTNEQLMKVLHKGSNKSVTLESSKYILNTNASESKIHPEKYYFSRDGLVKSIVVIDYSAKMCSALAEKISCPFLIIHYKESHFAIHDYHLPILEILKRRNTFEFYDIPGAHHGHLNNPVETSQLINNFLQKYWSRENKEKTKL